MVTQTEYDLAGRPRKKVTRTGTNHTYTGELDYNSYELASKFTETVGTARTKYTTEFAYDTENKPTALTYGTGSLNYTWDKLNRITKRRIIPGTTNINTTYTYYAGGHGTNSTTALVKTIVQGGVTLTYTYDDNGNITKVSDGTKQTEYIYDTLNQLVQVNDQTDTTAHSSGTKWVFEYDLGGNITSKKAYKYTSGDLYSSISYTYGASGWKDKLTAYNGNTISYDTIGNPTSDGTWTYTWEHGRQLKQMSKTGTTVQFEYNEEGLRTKKTVGSTVTNYILHGKNIVHMTKGSDTLHFYYDAHGKPAIVIFNGTAYGYLYNLQGDVVALVDASGTKVVEYSYDAWGKVLTKTGSAASSLGTVQPFRYRGYVYDEETELYYLRTRYYKPQYCRFINADVIVSSNLFCYTNNSAINTRDDHGTEATAVQPYIYDPSIIDAVFVSGLTARAVYSIPWLIGLSVLFTPASTANDEAVWEAIMDTTAYGNLEIALKYSKEKALNNKKNPKKATNIHTQLLLTTKKMCLINASENDYITVKEFVLINGQWSEKNSIKINGTNLDGGKPQFSNDDQYLFFSNQA